MERNRPKVKVTDRKEITHRIENPVRDQDLINVHDALMVAAVLAQCNHLRGKYAKQTLQRLENGGMLNPTARKHILDGFNELHRELETLLNQLQ